MSFADRLLTIVVTATLTSAAWIVAGGTVMDRAQNRWAEPDGAAQQAAASTVAPGARVPDAPQGLIPAVSRSGAIALDGDGTRIVAAANAPRGTLTIPVVGITPAQLVDTFTQARAGGARVHDAIDIMAPEGRPVIAAGPGTVEKLFFSQQGGKTVYVRSPDRTIIHYYAHLKDYAQGLAEGQQVRAGTPLGTVGWSGNASPDAPHLHFAVMRTTPQAAWYTRAVALNPYPLLVRR